MWLINSSIGRKFVMSITGIALVLFLLFHGTMNFVAILSPESYNAMLLHLYNFWFKMQFVEIAHKMGGDIGDLSLATDGAYYISVLFANPVYCVIYLIWLGAIWYHLTHGVWSALHTLGLNNKIWFGRIKCIGNIVATLVVLLFVAVVLHFGAQAIMNGTTDYVW